MNNSGRNHEQAKAHAAAYREAARHLGTAWTTDPVEREQARQLQRQFTKIAETWEGKASYLDREDFRPSVRHLVTHYRGSSHGLLCGSRTGGTCNCVGEPR